MTLLLGPGVHAKYTREYILFYHFRSTTFQTTSSYFLSLIHRPRDRLHFGRGCPEVVVEVLFDRVVLSGSIGVEDKVGLSDFELSPGEEMVGRNMIHQQISVLVSSE